MTSFTSSLYITHLVHLYFNDNGYVYSIYDPSFAPFKSFIKEIFRE